MSTGPIPTTIPPLRELISLFQSLISREGVTTGNGNVGGTSFFDSSLIGIGVNSYVNSMVIVYPGDFARVGTGVITIFNNVTGEVTFNPAYKNGQIIAGIPYKIINSQTFAALAFLDAPISSRAAIADYTAVRAVLLDNLDVLVSSRAVPGDAMALTAAERLLVQALVLNDATPFAGALIDAAISSRAIPGDAMTLTPAERLLVQALILNDVTPFPGGNIDATISSRAAAATALSTAVWTAARAAFLDNINNAQLLNIPDLSTLTVARIGYLDNINQVGLLQITAARAALLDQITAIRLAELDAANIPADIDAIKAVTDALPDGGALTTIQADLDNPAQYKADVAALALEATLTAIKGAGWTTETLKAIKDAIDAIPAGGDATEAKQDIIIAVLGALDDAAAAGAVTNVDTVMAYIKQLVTAIIHGTYGLSALQTLLTAITAGGPTNTQMETARDAIIAAIPAMRGTDNAALAADWTAGLAAILGNFTALRIGYLDYLLCLASSLSSGPNSPGTMADDATVGTVAWANPDNAKISNDAYATLDDNANSYDEYIIKLVKNGNIEGDDKSTFATLPIVDTYIPYGGSADLWGLVLTPADINAVDFGAVFSVSGVHFSHYLKATNFGFAIPANATINGILLEVEQKHIAFDRIAYVDHIRITVYYTVSALALEATLTAIKGAGWTTETLKAIYDLIALIPTTAMRGTDNAALAATALSTTQWTNALATALGNYTAARAGYLDELAAANIPTDIDGLKTSRDRQLFSMDFWSNPVEEKIVTAAQVTAAVGAPVVVADLPAGATIDRAIVMMKFRMVENTNAAENSLDCTAIQPIQVDDSVNTGWVTAIDFVDEQFKIAATTREGGDVLIGDNDVATRVDGNDTYDFQWLNAKAHLANIQFNDIQMGIRIWYSV